MVQLQSIEVVVQILKGDCWVNCAEFDSEETLEEFANTATRVTKGIECEAALFRFFVVLSKDFHWGDSANALRMDLFLGGGCSVNDYRVVALRPEAATLATKLGLDVMDADDSGLLSYRIQTIVFPLDVTEPHDIWYKASLVFERLDNSNVTGPKPSRLATAHRGTIRLNVFPCLATENPRKNSRIPIDPPSPGSESRYIPHHRITLQPGLRYDFSQTCSNVCRVQFLPVSSISHLSFVFLYRESNQYSRIEAEDIEIIKNKTFLSARRGQRVPRAAIRLSKVANEPPRTDWPSTGSPIELDDETTPADAEVMSPEGNSQSMHMEKENDSMAKVVHDKLHDKLPGNIGDLVPLLQKTAKMRRQSHQLQQEAAKAEAEAELHANRQRLEIAGDKIRSARKVLEEDCQRVSDLEMEQQILLEENEAAKSRLQDAEQEQDAYSSDDEGNILFETVRNAIETLHAHQKQKLQSRKRRRSEWSQGSAPPLEK